MEKAKVYFIPLDDRAEHAQVSEKAAELFRHIVEKESLTLKPKAGIKVHFGEAGNRTWISAKAFDGILDELSARGVESAFLETSVLYGGRRRNAESHKKLAAEHGFTRIPVEITDGEAGEASTLVPIEGKHFKTCAIGKGFEAYEQILVLAHFKGHALSGFGGAIKQLSMGFASKGGKMAMHMGIQPVILNFLCKRCGLCVKRCQVDAIDIQKKPGKSRIDHSKCLGCGACYAACPSHAVSILSWKGLKNMLFRKDDFREKLVEYALASHKGRSNIYLNFAINITKGCDCEPHPMLRTMNDIGILASTDPVAVDAACWDLCAARGTKFKGAEQLDYVEKLGLGSRTYDLITITK